MFNPFLVIKMQLLKLKTKINFKLYKLIKVESEKVNIFSPKLNWILVNVTDVKLLKLICESIFNFVGYSFPKNSMSIFYKVNTFYNKVE